MSSEKSESAAEVIRNQYCRDTIFVEYFRKYTKNKQVMNALFARLSNLPQRSLVDIIPNIIYIYRNVKNKDVQAFIYQLCQRSQTIYLRIRWAFKAYDQNDYNHQEQYEQILNNIDSAMMNRNQLDESSMGQNDFQTKIQQFVELKAHQSICIHQTNQFYSRLTKITIKLKDYTPQQRENQLRLYLEKFYERFLSTIAKKASRCLPGMYFPIPSQSNFVVQINYEHCLPFSTKQRVPYKLVFQTVNYDELIKSEKEKQELTKSVFKAINAKISTQCDTESTKENEDNDRIQKQTAAKLNEYMKNNLDLSQQKLQVSYLKSNRKYFDEMWKTKVEAIVEKSAYKGLKSHRIRAYMVKGGDDIVQQFFAMELLKQTYSIFQKQKLKIWLKIYDVVIFTRNSGFIEFIPDTMTISSLKKNDGRSLRSIYKHLFGDRLDHAIKNFVLSLAGYSIVQYVFQIKDRHNGNIMIDSEGHIIHIDFGFLLGSSPGNMNFQKAPFKLTKDYIELMEGQDSAYYTFYRQLLFLGFSILKKYIKQILSLIEVMREKSDMPCFWYFKQKDIRYRMMQNCTDQEIRKRIDGLLYESGYSYYTRHYDRFQWYTNGIYR